MKIKSYQLIIFDFDGTLVDTASDIAFHANEILKEFGLGQRPIEAVKKAVGRGVHELLKDLGIIANEKRLEQAVASFKRRYWESPVIHTRPYPGVREMLSGPLKNIRKTIVTNKPYGLTVKILQALSLESYFETVIGLDLQYPAKPDPASVRFVMDRWNTDTTKTLFIGDSAVDAETSENAGIDFGWVDYGYDTLKSLQKPLLRFSSPYEWEALRSFTR